ncbi:MAG: uridylate kinase [Archaeoglobaceae archaeon]|nr:uridylate kinase [Archaeoglobaceae archaeon]MCX8151860.1 uridylate kinase [Archaeoglobaceae archaeon]MDW8014308.1 uridylate kinase [Archaeoglobaceae archaeon]
MIVKVGGSVANALVSIVDFLKDKKVLIVPGGWIFADLVRTLKVSEEAAHWMAVMAMNQYGYYIAEKGLETIEPEDFNFKWEKTCVLLPYKLLRKYDELPHSWKVTSDSISAWIAYRLGEKMAVKLCAVDGIYLDGKILRKVKASELREIKTDVVDEYLSELLSSLRINYLVCNFDGLKNYILRREVVGTLIVGGE